MRARYLVPAVLLLAACGTNKALCPVDTTTKIDATITQILNRPKFRPTQPASRAEFAVTIENRTNEPLVVRSISLGPTPTLIPASTGLRQCFGLEHLDYDIGMVSEGFDQTIAPGASGTFDFLTRRTFMKDDVNVGEPISVLTLDVRTESSSGTRTDRLTRKVTMQPEADGAGL